MEVYKQIEQAKDLIKQNKFDESLSLLDDILPKANQYQSDVIFEIGKIYMLKKEYNKSISFLIKISQDKVFYNLVNDLLFKIYKQLHKYQDMLNIYDKLKEINKITPEVIKDSINAAKIIKQYKKAIEMVQTSKVIEIHDEILNKIIDELYNEISIYMQELNIKSKNIDVKQLFNDIYKYIPENNKKIRNILLNEYEISQGKVYLISKPRSLTISLTTKCNLKCKMCGYSVNKKTQSELSDKYCDDLIEVIPCLERLILQGGEVFLYKRFNEIFKITCKEKVKLEIVTNGLLLNKEIIKELVLNNTMITISIDGFTKDVYESIRIGAKFEKLIENLNCLYKTKKQFKTKFIMRLQMVVMKSNYQQINLIFDFAKKYGFDEIALLPVESGYIERQENIFDIGFDENIIRELESNRYLFSKKAKEYKIVLKNCLPTIDFYNNVIDKKYSINDNLKIKNIFSNKLSKAFDKKIINIIK
ncbi:MAG: radical SAM protein, partial [Endomicrobiia bacterium]